MQPFILMEPRFIDRLIQVEKVYLVSQTYVRGTDESKTGLLLTDYDDEGLAKIHLNAIKGDKLGSIVRLDVPEHKDKLVKILAPDSVYSVFWSVINSKEELMKLINHTYKYKLRRYVSHKTNWRINRDHVLTPQLEMIFGELYIAIKYNRQKLKVKFSEIENC